MDKIAIIGTGIAGMAASYFLHQQAELTIFEKNSRIGGHTHTVDVEGLPIDTGFIVFNYQTYPLLTRLFKKLDVPHQDAPMTFSIQHRPSKLEYSGTGVKGLFTPWTNLFKPSYLKMLAQIARFNKEALTFLNRSDFDSVTIQEMVETEGYGLDFLYKYLIPMSGAVWSTPAQKMLKFPAKSLIQFFHNHGFLGLNTQHQWKTVTGGSRVYRDKLIKPFQKAIQTYSKIQSVKVQDHKVLIQSEDRPLQTFDKVIFACHADEALVLLEKPTKLQERLLSAFTYQPNQALLHTDNAVMPRSRGNWSAWNYRVDSDESAHVHYYMNALQSLKTQQHYFVSLNAQKLIKPEHVLKKIDYHHPLFDTQAYQAQKLLPELNAEPTPLYFCGSYFRYGFHEDALLSAVNLMSDHFPLSSVQEFLA